MLDINFEHNLWDMFIFYKSGMGICMYEGSMLDGSAYQEVMLDTKLVTSLGRDMLLTLLRFPPATWVPQPLPYLPPHHLTAGGCGNCLESTPAGQLYNLHKNEVDVRHCLLCKSHGYHNLMGSSYSSCFNLPTSSASFHLGAVR